MLLTSIVILGQVERARVKRFLYLQNKGGRIIKCKTIAALKLLCSPKKDISQLQNIFCNILNRFCSESGKCRAVLFWHSIGERDITQNFSVASTESVISRKIFLPLRR